VTRVQLPAGGGPTRGSHDQGCLHSGLRSTWEQKGAAGPMWPPPLTTCLSLSERLFTTGAEPCVLGHLDEPPGMKQVVEWWLPLPLGDGCCVLSGLLEGRKSSLSYSQTPGLYFSCDLPFLCSGWSLSGSNLRKGHHGPMKAQLPRCRVWQSPETSRERLSLCGPLVHGLAPHHVCGQSVA
jgi:hypothetical protein